MGDASASVFNAEIVRRQDFTEDLFVLGVRLRDQPLASFEAGQYATLGLLGDAPPGGNAKLIKRPYSIASGGNETDCYEFLITTVPDGQLTPRLHRARVGEPIWMDPKVRGKFFAASNCPDSDVIMIATGTGLAPFRAMWRSFPMGQRWKRLAIIHGVRQVKDAVYGEEIAALRKDSNVRYVAAVSRETPTNLVRR